MLRLAQCAIRRLPAAGLGLLVVLLAACAGPKKNYVEPTDPAGQACLSECKVTRMDCHSRNREVHRECQRRREYQEREYRYCQAQGGTFCTAPQICTPPDVSPCVNQYEGCFQSCGGVIQIESPSGS